MAIMNPATKEGTPMSGRSNVPEMDMIMINMMADTRTSLNMFMVFTTSSSGLAAFINVGSRSLKKTYK